MLDSYHANFNIYDLFVIENSLDFVSLYTHVKLSFSIAILITLWDHDLNTLKSALQSLKRSHFPFSVHSTCFHSLFTVRSPCALRSVLRSAFTSRSHSPFTNHLSFIHRTFTARSPLTMRLPSVHYKLFFFHLNCH